ncbi:MAG TPA: LPS export ABC transporter ATP-binding protein [Thermoanaerobaculaceae bacterium]|nr:LPS export ABC transporter ATP-binding protein [Acidobacteriota bacterium]NLH12206.1 LPS export ABC transporter ATP-binding protein [Holophagae bacterium]HPW56023.1 LPS export ABC transporter ATP-binding protein [Thermoanaerobaculaceae bacterium]
MQLAARDLVKRYRQRTVVDGVSLDVHAGEVVGLLGPNGAGKTTTFYMLVGLIEPDGGNVLLGEQDVTWLPMYKRARLGISYLPQEPSVFRRLTVEENLAGVMELLGTPRQDAALRVAELLEEFGLDKVQHQRADTLSGGERRRLEIARSLVASPRFLLLDEPFAGIDPITVLEVQKLIRHLRDRGYGILITDHNVRDTLKITDRASIIKDGKVFGSGDPERLARDPMVQQVYLGEGFEL